MKVLMVGADLSVQGGITSVEKLILDNCPKEISIRHLPTFTKGGFDRNSKLFLKSLFRLFLLLLKRDVDLIHIHFSERGSTIRKFIFVQLILIFRKPFILHSHGAAYKEFFSGLPKFLQWLVASTFRQCDFFIALSESWKAYFIRSFGLVPKKTVVLYNPVQLPIDIPKRTAKKNVTFVFLGRIGKRGGALDAASNNLPKQDKGAFDLIRAFAMLSEPQIRKSRLILAGDGEIDAARNLVDSLRITSQVSIYSWLDPAQRDDILRNADVFILPSYHEGLPMSMLEAMAWALPVIVTPVGGIPEVVFHQQNGLLVQPGNLTEIASEMERLISDEDLRISLGTSARQSAEALDATAYMQKLYDLYTSVLLT